MTSSKQWFYLSAIVASNIVVDHIAINTINNGRRQYGRVLNGKLCLT